MSNGFDRIAPYYDTLARLVFGDSIRRCQLKYLDQIPLGGKLLILGGGTGWILPEIKKINPTCTVWYVESSRKMIEIAKARFNDLTSAGIFFIHGTEKDLHEYSHISFDAVITNFYLDLFTSSSLENAMKSIEERIYPGSKLLVADFVDQAWWHHFLLFAMYRFFRWTSGIEAGSLSDWRQKLKSKGFAEERTTLFYSGFIKTAVYVFEEKQSA